MISPTQFRELVSGRRRGFGATLARGGLWAASVPYGWAVRRRNRRYDSGAASVYRAAAPVVSVGNLTVGGSGKTPMVEWIVKRLLQAGVRPAILSRGYRAAEGSANDEALELELALGDVPHLQDPDRAATAARATAECGAQILVLDDGFQHRRLARDLDIVLLDASEPFGFDHLLPRGTLREPAEGLARAHVVALSRADMLDASGREAVRRRAKELCPHGAWCEVEHRPSALLSADGTRAPVESINDQRVAVFCGIGNPAGFKHTLVSLGSRVVTWREFPDHHAYSPADLAELSAWVQASQVDFALCTRKDLVKVRVDKLAHVPLRAVEATLRFLHGEDAMHAAIDPLVAPLRQQSQLPCKLQS